MADTESKKLVVVTGATRGIGRSIALHFAARDHLVVATGRSNGADLVDEITQKGGEAHFMQLDVTNESAVNELFDELKQKFGGCAILINNAGISKDFLFMRSKTEDWLQVINTNYLGSLFCARAATKQMVKQKWGRIVNVASIAGIIGNPGQTLYSSTKAAIIGFTRSLAKEVGSRNITVNSVAPGFIETDMTSSLPDEVKEGYLKRSL